MIFKDISNFNNVNDYLPILVSCVNIDLLVLFLVFHGFLNSVYLKKWYKRFQLWAILADISILFLIIILTRFIYGYIFSTFNILTFTGLAVLIQIIHDLSFSMFFTTLPKGINFMLDFFKKYAKEVGISALLGDSFIIILTCLTSSYFANFSLNTNIISLIFSVYFLPFMINYE